MSYPALIRIAVWVGTTTSAYILAFGVASVVDIYILQPFQHVAERALSRVDGVAIRKRQH